MQPLSLTDEAPHPINPDSDEGLIWDSEVKVEVDEMQFEMLPPRRKRVNDVADTDHEQDDKRILESHVEVKVDFGSSSGTGEEDSSPLFPSSATRSNPSSVDTSPPSPSYRTKRYGFALPPGVTYDLDDADDDADDSDDYPEIYDWTSSPLFRGRSMTRKELTSFEIYGVSPNGSDVSAKGKGLSGLKSLRSISSNLRSSTITKNDTKGGENDAGIADKPRTLFRGLRSRKSSPLVAQSVEAGRTVGLQSAGPYNNLEPKPTKKSGLKSWAKFMIPERKRNKRVVPRELKNQGRSCAPSPTGSWARTQKDHHDELPILASKSETAFDTGSVTSLIDTRIEKEEALEATNLKIPDSPKLLADVPAAYHDRRSIEIEVHQDDSEEKIVNDITMPQHRPDIAAVSMCGAEHVEEAKELAKSEITTAEDQPLVEADHVEEVQDVAKSEINTTEDQPVVATVSMCGAEHVEEAQEVDKSEINTAEDQPLVEADHVEEAQEVDKNEINTAEDQPLVEADLLQKDATTNDPIATIPTREPGGLKEEEEEEEEEEEGAGVEESASSEQDADSNEASTQRDGKSLPSPRSTFIQSIIESSNARPHPPRKSSLRHTMSIRRRSASGIPKFSFPLPPIKAESMARVEEESSLLSETTSDFRH